MQGYFLKIILKTGNILDEQVDVMICSANVHLTLSGGVGADLLARYGTSMQRALEAHVKQRTPHFVTRGEIIAYAGPELPYRAILHAVAVDGWYDSSPALIEDIVRRCLQLAARDYAARTVALTALATGFGHLTLGEFGEGLRPLLAEAFPPVEEVRIVLMEDYRLEELARSLPDALRSPA